MREIKLSGEKVYANTRQLVDAIAWATNRRGRNPWKSDVNVALAIYSYLDEYNVDIPSGHKNKGSHSSITYVLTRLVKDGFGDVTVNRRGTYITFRFKDDVNLNGHMPRFRTHTETPEVKEETPVTHIPVPARTVEMPLPPAPKPERYLGSNVNAALDIWSEHDPDTYAKWAETLIERLAALYGVREGNSA